MVAASPRWRLGASRARSAEPRARPARGTGKTASLGLEPSGLQRARPTRGACPACTATCPSPQPRVVARREATGRTRLRDLVERACGAPRPRPAAGPSSGTTARTSPGGGAADRPGGPRREGAARSRSSPAAEWPVETPQQACPHPHRRRLPRRRAVRGAGSTTPARNRHQAECRTRPVGVRHELHSELRRVGDPAHCVVLRTSGIQRRIPCPRLVRAICSLPLDHPRRIPRTPSTRPGPSASARSKLRPAVSCRTLSR